MLRILVMGAMYVDGTNAKHCPQLSCYHQL